MRSCQLSIFIAAITFFAFESAITLGTPAAVPAPASASAGLPVTEVTIFKDGHAFVLQEGRAAVDAAGNVTLDQLPQPVLGTFWPYAAEPGTKLVSVTASNREVSQPRTATTIRDLLEANIGASVHIYDTDGRDYLARGEGTNGRGTIVAVPRPAPRPAATADAAGAVPAVEARPPETGSIAVFKIDDTIKVVPIDRIRDVIFDTPPARDVATRQTQGALTLHLSGRPANESGSAKVGYMYLQKGLRWIPNYKVAIDGQGKAAIRLQATLVNELTDLKGVTVHLVVGVPTFAFKDDIDPISLQQVAAQLGPLFRPESQTAYAFGNAIMSQQAVYEPRSAPRPASSDTDNLDSGQQEDLFIFTLKDISLAKGERMVVPIADYELAYQDVYVLDIPWSPPVEMQQRVNSPSESELARLAKAPKVMHRLRIKNEGKYPLTTAPALIVQGDRPLAQGMMKYTAIGATGDLDVTVATDLAARRTDAETKRTPNAERWHDIGLIRVDMNGSIRLSNQRRDTVQVEVVRHVLGQVDAAEQGGDVSQVALEDVWESAGARPTWWYWYSWPWWWSGVNGVGEIHWKVTLEPGAQITLKYSWHYFWA